MVKSKMSDSMIYKATFVGDLRKFRPYFEFKLRGPNGQIGNYSHNIKPGKKMPAVILQNFSPVRLSDYVPEVVQIESDTAPQSMELTVTRKPVTTPREVVDRRIDRILKQHGVRMRYECFDNDHTTFFETPGVSDARNTHRMLRNGIDAVRADLDTRYGVSLPLVSVQYGSKHLRDTATGEGVIKERLFSF